MRPFEVHSQWYGPSHEPTWIARWKLKSPTVVRQLSDATGLPDLTGWAPRTMAAFTESAVFKRSAFFRVDDKDTSIMVTQNIVSDTTLPDGPIPERALAPGAQASSPALFSLAGTTTIITGGGRGLGQALAKGIAQAGGSVACIDLLPEPVNDQGQWDEIRKITLRVGGIATYHVCDITNEILMKETLEEVERSNPRSVIRGVVACAGVQQMVPAVDYPLDGFRRIMEIK